MSGAISAGETILGKYRIVRMLGEGGMARVWLAEELTFGNRQVALKEPRPDLPAADLVDLRLRYEREVQTCAELEKLGATQVVRAITADPYDDSVLLVMEYLTGDLAKLLSQHPNGLPVERAMAITLSVLGALHTAHSHPWEIVHRDVKPSNILLDGQGNARLGDWGLAQSTYKSGRTQLIAGAHPGTQGYMAPEQLSSPAPLNPSADIYALGCVLFEMLVGKCPQRFRPGTTITSLRGDAPAWLDAVLAKALAIDPWERYQSAEEMQAALKEQGAGGKLQEAGGKLQGASGGPIPSPQSPVPDSQIQPARSQPKRGGFWQWLLGENEEKQPVQPAPQTASGAVPPFRLRNGKEARSLNELVALCVADPPAAIWHLNSGHFEPWLKASGYDALLRILEQLQKEALTNQERLKRFLDATGVRHSYKAGPMGNFDWVHIPAGEFLMGSNPKQDRASNKSEYPQHRVYLPNFYIARTPVTNAQWKVFVDSTVQNPPQHWNEGKIPRGLENHPVVMVSWDEAIAFCEWAGVYLPTEAEWEKAARGIDGRIYPWGYEDPDSTRCNFSKNGSYAASTTPIAKYPKGASPYGVMDMVGNIWEWTSSLYKPYPYQADDGRENINLIPYFWTKTFKQKGFL